MAITPPNKSGVSPEEQAKGFEGLTGASVPRQNPIIDPLAQELPSLKPEERTTLTREYLTKKLPQWNSLKPAEREQLVGEVVQKYGQSPTEKVSNVAHAAMSSPEMALRTIPPILAQGGAMMLGSHFGGGPGERAASAAASVGNDFYQRFLNHMYGEPNTPVSAQNVLNSALGGAIIPEAPNAVAKTAEGITGLRGARKIAEGAAADARTANVALAKDQAKIQAGVAGQRAEAQAKIGKVQQEQLDKINKIHESGQAAIAREQGKQAGTVSEATSAAIAKTEKSRADIQATLQENRDKLHRQIGRSLEQARPEVAQQVGTQKIQGMLGSTPQQVAAREAAPSAEFAAQRSAVMAPVFEGAQQYHAEVGKLYEPHVKPFEKNIVEGDRLNSLQQGVQQIKDTTASFGGRIVDSDLNKIMTRIQNEVGTVEKPAFGSNVSNDAIAKLTARLNAEHGVHADPLTIGELWGMRARAGRVLAKSSNPTDRLVAHQLMDHITELMPEVPQSVKNQYAAERSQFGPKMMGEIARARNPAEVGAAIFGSPSSPEPAQLALNLINRAKTPEAKQGLQTAFADNWLSKPHSADDIGRYNPAVIKGLFGDASKDVYAILGHEGTVKSASWGKLLSASPEARDAYTKAKADALNSESALTLKKAIKEGESALAGLPDTAAIQKQVQAAKSDPEKIQILQQALEEKMAAHMEASNEKIQGLKDQAAKIGPTEKQAETLAKQPTNPRDAAVTALGKRGLVPDSRLEKIALSGLAFRTLYAAAGAGGTLAKHPGIAIGLGGLLGGRALVRMALSNPKLGRAYVNALRLGAEPKNAASVGKIIGSLTAAAALQSVKEMPLNIGQPALSQPQPNQSSGNQ